MVSTEALKNLCDSVKTHSLMALVQNSDFNSSSLKTSAREQACAIISQLQYTNHQAPREIIVCPGFIGACNHTLNLAKILNDSKERFKRSILALKTAKIPTTDHILGERINNILRIPTTTETLKRFGLSRLQLKQCYRKIPILDDIPEKISWTWANTRSIKKITVLQAQALLQKKGDDPGILIQLNKLSTLDLQEELAIVQELAPHLRANIVFGKEASFQRTMIKAPIPIFFPATSQSALPKFSPPKEKSGKNESRSKRSDIKLDPIPFLPAIRAHRYLLRSL
jgi:hypothetical protein